LWKATLPIRLAFSVATTRQLENNGGVIRSTILAAGRTKRLKSIPLEPVCVTCALSSYLRRAEEGQTIGYTNAFFYCMVTFLDCTSPVNTITACAYRLYLSVCGWDV